MSGEKIQSCSFQSPKTAQSAMGLDLMAVLSR